MLGPRKTKTQLLETQQLASTREFWLNLQTAYDLRSEDDEEEEPK
jgi:plasmid maintenance system antidote protein VapI